MGTAPKADVNQPTCTVCGAELPLASPGSRCPACLLDLTIQLGGESPGAEATSGQRFGDYELLEETGRGGMGLVYKARQLSLNRVVALKLILSGQFASKQEVLRFRGEAEAAANLRHPNIVAIYETGEHDGQHYFSMEYVPGRNLAEIVHDGPLPAKRAARYAEIIARAIHYAHQQGTLHRDLKPSNVLIDANDQPRVTDFGLAKRLRSDFGVTVTGQVLGSPHFMPPEQTSGKRGSVGPPSDVYGLGALLYHLVTGRPPFQAGSLEEVLRELHEKDPVSPRLLNASVPRDLETICLRCLEKEPGRRYTSAEELADELGRFLRNEPIHSRPINGPERLWRWCRRKPVVAGLLAAVHLLALALIIGGITAALRIQHGATVLRENLYAADINVAARALNEDNLGLARELLERYYPGPEQRDLRGFEWRYLWNRCQGDESASITAHDGAAIAALAISPDQQWLATGGHDRAIKLWHFPTRAFEATVATRRAAPPWTGGVTFSGDGKHLAIMDWEGIRLLETAHWTEIQMLPEPASQFAFLPRSHGVVGGIVGASIWQPPTWHPCRIGPASLIQAEKSNRHLYAVNPQETSVAVTHDEGVSLLDIFSGDLTVTLPHVQQARPYAVAWSPDGHLLAVGTLNGEVWIWDADNRSLLTKLAPHKMFVIGLAFSPDGQRLATGGSDQFLTLWTVQDWRMEARLLGHGNGIWGLAFSPDGQTLVSGSRDGTVKFWEVQSATRPPALLDAHTPIGISPDSQTVVTLDRDATLKLWNLVTLQLIRSYRLSETNQASAGRLASDGKTAAIGYRDGTVELRDLDSGELGRRFHGPTNLPVWGLELSPDGRFIAVQIALPPHPKRSGRAAIFDTASGSSAFAEAVAQGVCAIAFSVRHDLMAVAEPSGIVVLWDLKTNRVVRQFSTSSGEIVEMVFSPDDATLVTVSYDSRSQAWDVGTGRLRGPLRGQTIATVAVRYSPDGKTIATAGMDRTVTLWQAATLRPLTTFPWDGVFLGPILFAPDGHSLVAGAMLPVDEGGAVQVWRAPPLSALDTQPDRSGGVRSLPSSMAHAIEPMAQ